MGIKTITWLRAPKKPSQFKGCDTRHRMHYGPLLGAIVWELFKIPFPDDLENLILDFADVDEMAYSEKALVLIDLVELVYVTLHA